MVKLYIGNDLIGTLRALGDTGAHPNVIGHKIVKHYYSKASMVQGNMIGIGNQSLQIKRKIVLGLQPWYENDPSKIIRVTFWILPKATEWNPMLPERDIQCAEISNEIPLELADPLFWKADNVSMILGVGTWTSILKENLKRLNSNLICQESKFGHVIYGQIGENKSGEIKGHVHSIEENSLEDLNRAIKRFWEFEDLPMCTNKDLEHELVEQAFQETHYRDLLLKFL